MSLLYSYYDVIILGAGASGLACAITAGSREFSCALIDKSPVAGKKIRIAGGGKANVTNINMHSKFYISNNSKFCQKVLNHYPPEKLLDLLNQYNIPWETRSYDQIFCTVQASQLVKKLVQHCSSTGAHLWLKQNILDISIKKNLFIISTTNKTFCAPQLVIALGSCARPTTGSSNYGLTIAQQWQHTIIPTRPALVPLVLKPNNNLCKLTGISLPVNIHVGTTKHPQISSYPLLFTHKGLSGPAVLQASCFWRKEQTITINFLPKISLIEEMHKQKTASTVVSFIKNYLPQRVLQSLIPPNLQKQKVIEMSKTTRKYLANLIHNYTLTPLRTEGLEKAEVMAGGINTHEVHPHTLESLLQKNLYFTGEVLDVTGMLGGYNLHWAWASGYAVGRALRK